MSQHSCGVCAFDFYNATAWAAQNPWFREYSSLAGALGEPQNTRASQEPALEFLAPLEGFQEGENTNGEADSIHSDEDTIHSDTDTMYSDTDTMHSGPGSDTCPNTPDGTHGDSDDSSSGLDSGPSDDGESQEIADSRPSGGPLMSGRRMSVLDYVPKTDHPPAGSPLRTSLRMGTSEQDEHLPAPREGLSAS